VGAETKQHAVAGRHCWLGGWGWGVGGSSIGGSPPQTQATQDRECLIVSAIGLQRQRPFRTVASRSGGTIWDPVRLGPVHEPLAKCGILDMSMFRLTTRECSAVQSLAWPGLAWAFFSSLPLASVRSRRSVLFCSFTSRGLRLPATFLCCRCIQIAALGLLYPLFRTLSLPCFPSPSSPPWASSATAEQVRQLPLLQSEEGRDE
jgi:hypothetical protein